MAVMRAGVVGVGDMGKNHVRIYNELEDVDLVCICDNDEDKARQISRIYKAPYFTELEDMLKSNKIDIASVAVPTAHHYDIATKLIDEGIGIIVEKPIDLELERARMLVARAKDAGVPLMVGHIERFNPAVIKLKEMIGELGTPTVAQSTRVGPLPNRVKDVGAIVDLGVHDFDILRYILESDVERLTCECGRIINKTHTDYAKIFLRFQNGLVGSIDVNWLTPVKIRRLVIQGVDAMFEVNYILQELYKYEISYVREFSDWSDILLGMMEGEMRRIPIKAQEPLKIELQQFVQAVAAKKPVPVSGEDGVRALELALLSEQSGKDHRIIEF